MADDRNPPERAMKEEHAALLDNLRECGVAFRMLRDALAELSGAVPPVAQRDVGPPDYLEDAREIIDGIIRLRTAARAEGWRDAIEATKNFEPESVDFWSEADGNDQLIEFLDRALADPGPRREDKPNG